MNAMNHLSDKAEYTLELRNAYTLEGAIVLVLFTNYQPYRLVDDEDRRAVIEIVKSELELTMRPKWYFDHEHYGERPPGVPLDTGGD